MYFKYGPKETDYLKNRCPRLARVIERVGPVRREADGDLFSAVVHHMVGQQISTRAQATVWRRVREQLGQVNAQRVCALQAQELQRLGMSRRKAEYILDFARKVQDGEVDLAAVAEMDDAQAITHLSALRGIGVWTAEMLLLFCLQRPDVLSYDDLAIQRGLRMVYRHRKITRALFEKYRRRFSPYGSVASLYLWAVAGGAVPELTDPAVRQSRQDKPVK